MKSLLSFLMTRSEAVTADVIAAYRRRLKGHPDQLAQVGDTLAEDIGAFLKALLGFLNGRSGNSGALDRLLADLGERRARQGFPLALVLEQFHLLRHALNRQVQHALRSLPDLTTQLLLNFNFKLCQAFERVDVGVTRPYLQVQENVIEAQQAFLKHKFSNLFRLVEAISNNLNIQEFCELLLDYLCKFYDVKVSAVFLLDERGRELYPHHVTGLSRRFLREQRHSADDAPFKDCLDSGRAVAVEDAPYAADDLAAPAPEPAAPGDKRRASDGSERPAANSLYAPMIGRQRTYGVVSIHAYRGRHYAPSEVQQLETLARIVAVALENARFYDTLIEEKGKLDAIVNSITDGLILINFHEEIIFINEQAARYLRAPANKLVGAPAALVPERLLANAKEPHVIQAEYLRALVNIVDHPLLEFTLYSGGDVTDLRLTMFPVKDREQRFIGRGLIIEDVSREKEINRMKSEFVAIASHTMRTPMTSILGYASLLAERQLPEATQTRYIQSICQESQRLAGILNDMLDLTNIEAGKISLKLMPLDLHELVAKLVKASRESTRRELTLTAAPNLPHVFADPDKLRQVVTNLLDNAVKYSEGKVAVSLKVLNRPAFLKEWDRSAAQLEAPGYFPALCVSVTDACEGIPAAQLEAVFEPFMRLDNERTQRHTGSGLGLTIARYVVEAHGGKIWVESKAKKGCRFSFILPLQLTRGDHEPGRLMS
jgi:signal transduction histidine kinase